MEEYKAKLKTLSMVAYGSMCYKLGYNNRVIDKVCLIFLDNLLFSLFSLIEMGIWSFPEKENLDLLS